MMNSTIDQQELDKFAQHASQWWDRNGPLKTLHDINQTRLDFILEQGSLLGLNLLDVGCGGGILCEAMAEHGAKVCGLDAEKQVIEVAKAHSQSHNLAIDYVCSSLEDYQPHQNFDVITCMEMLEHVAKPELIMERCHSLLKPGGLLFLSTINKTLKAYASAILAAEYILNILPKQTHDFEKFIPPSDLAAMTRNCGFKLISLKGLSYNPFSRKASLSTDVSVNYLMALRSE